MNLPNSYIKVLLNWLICTRIAQSYTHTYTHTNSTIIYTHIHTHTDTHTHTCTHTDTHTDTHMYTGDYSPEEAQALMWESEMRTFYYPNVMSLLVVCLDAGPAPYNVLPFMSCGDLLLIARKRMLGLPAGGMQC